MLYADEDNENKCMHLKWYGCLIDRGTNFNTFIISLIRYPFKTTHHQGPKKRKTAGRVVKDKVKIAKRL